MSLYTKVRNATVQDCDFIGLAIRDAERAHTGHGIWDVYVNGCQVDNIAAKALAHVAKYGEKSIYHYTRFFVVENEEGQPVASACGYPYPVCSFLETMAAMGEAMRHLADWTDSDVLLAKERLEFMADSFPQDLDWGSRWMVEGVYTSPSYRGRGLGELALRAAVEAGREKDLNSCWITCAVGNDGACRLYERVGFKVIGEGNSEQCMAVLATPGFKVLGKKL
mmetsp:Transcript_9098/g.13695  ORF Transcript_9098/g.13695 Transcript_9098/m.13695 type:complete len:223 (-) Transcript_9098:304-972(-)